VNAKIFGDDRYHGNGNYDVSPAALCALIAPGQAAACAALVGNLDLRLHTTASPQAAHADPDDEGFLVGVQIGPDHVEALTITLASRRDPLGTIETSLTAALDLEVLQRALTGLPGVPPTKLSGHLTIDLSGGPFGALFSVHVDRALSIAIAGASGDLAGHDAFSLTSAPGFIDLDLTSAAGLPPLVTLALGATALELPAGADGKRHGFAMAALTGGAQLDPFPDTAISVTDLSFGGPLTITRDGATARTLALDPDDGNKLSFAVSGVKTFSFVPLSKLDLRLTVDHAVLGDTAPAFDVSQILLDGTVAATAAPARVELQDGSFRIDTVPAGHGFTAAAGQCITDSVTATVQWTVGACP
jgi:hypothetical protein